MKPTIRDVAREAGVSVSTVSRVLNGKPDISEDAARRVKAAIESLRFVPSNLARGMVLSQTRAIGLLLPDMTNPYFAALSRGIAHRAEEFGYTVILFDTDGDPAREARALSLMNSHHVSGAIAALSERRHRSATFDPWGEPDFPLVQLDRIIPLEGIPTVAEDNKASAAEAIRYLRNNGHTRIAHITGDLGTSSARERLKGYRAAMRELGAPIESVWIQKGDFGMAAGKRAMARILSANAKPIEKPTAVFCANDLTAIGAIQAIEAAGLSVPRDISVMGHDDIDFAALTTPALTTMRLDTIGMGRKAVETLMRLLDERTTIGESTLLSTTIIERDSVTSIRRKGDPI